MLEGSEAVIGEIHTSIILGIHLNPSVLYIHFCHLQLVFALVLVNALGGTTFLGGDTGTTGTSMRFLESKEGGLPSIDLEAVVGLKVFRFLGFR